MRAYVPLFFFASTASAQAAQQPLRLPKVVALGYVLPDPDPLDSAGATRITAQDLERRQATTLADALRRIPGAYVTQNGGIGQEARVSLRGTGGANTTVMVNGMPIYDAGAFDEAVNLSRWDADDIEEIQVIRGPMGSLYGPSGMGGVIAIETKKGQGPFKAFAKAEGGSFHTASQMAGVQGTKGMMDYHIAGSRLQSAGASPTPSQFLSQIQGKPNNPLHQEKLTARFGVGPESRRLSFFSHYLTHRLGFRQAPIDPYPWRQNFSQSLNRLQGHFENATGRWSHDIGLGYSQNHLTNAHPTQSQVTRNSSQVQVDWRQTYAMTERLRLQVATDGGQEKLYWRKAPSLNNAFKVVHGGIGGTLSYQPYENLMATGSTRIDKCQGVPVTPTYRFGGQYLFGKVTLKGGAGTAFKAPTLQQKFYQSPFFSGNPNLKPERSFGWDFGMGRPFFQNRLELEITFFQNRVRDLIAGSPNGATLVNINRSQTRGAEGLMRFHLTPDWVVEVSHTYTQAWDEKIGNGLIDTPRNKTVFCINGQVSPEWKISGTALYIGPRDTHDAIALVRVKTPSYTLVGAETAYQLSDQWQIYGRGGNVLNHPYQNPKNFQQPGIGLYMGVRAQW